MRRSTVICALSIATVVLVLWGALLSTTGATLPPPAQQSTIAVRTLTDAPPASVSVALSALQSNSNGNGCALGCAPACVGLDHDCVALNTSVPLRAAVQSLVTPLLRTRAAPAGPAWFRQQHRPAPSLLLLSITRI